MGIVIKYIVIALIIIAVFTSLLFTGTLDLLGLTISEARVGIEFVPIELRVILFLIILGIMFAVGKSFFK